MSWNKLAVIGSSIVEELRAVKLGFVKLDEAYHASIEIVALVANVLMKQYAK
jgi:hypothetical protein